MIPSLLKDLLDLFLLFSQQQQQQSSSLLPRLLEIKDLFSNASPSELQSIILSLFQRSQDYPDLAIFEVLFPWFFTSLDSQNLHDHHDPSSSMNSQEWEQACLQILHILTQASPMICKLLAKDQSVIDLIFGLGLRAKIPSFASHSLAVLLALICHASSPPVTLDIWKILETFFLDRQQHHHSAEADEEVELIVLVLTAAYAVHRNAANSNSQEKNSFSPLGLQLPSNSGGIGRYLKPLTEAVAAPETWKHAYYLAGIAALSTGTPVGIKFFSVGNLQKCLKMLIGLFAKERLYSAKVAGMFFLLLLSQDSSNALRNVLKSCEELLEECCLSAIKGCCSSDFVIFDQFLALLDCFKRNPSTFQSIYSTLMKESAFHACLCRWIHGFGCESTRTCLFIAQHFPFAIPDAIQSELVALVFETEFLRQICLSSQNSCAFDVVRGAFLVFFQAFFKRPFSLEQTNLKCAISFMQKCLLSSTTTTTTTMTSQHHSGIISIVDLALFQAYLLLMLQLPETPASIASLRLIVGNSKFISLMRASLWRLSDEFFIECTLSNFGTLGDQWIKAYAKQHRLEVERNAKIQLHLATLADEIKQVLASEAKTKSLKVFVEELRERLQVEEASNAELQEQMKNLQEAVFESQEETTKLLQQNLELNRQISNLQVEIEKQKGLLEGEKIKSQQLSEKAERIQGELESSKNANLNLEQELKHLKEQSAQEQERLRQSLEERDSCIVEKDKQIGKLMKFHEAIQKVQFEFEKKL